MQEASRQELKEIWDAVREDLRGALPQSAFESWLEPLRPVGAQGGRLYLDGPLRVRDWFERRYGALALSALQRHAPGLHEIAFSDGSAPAPEAERFTSELPRDLDFDRFVIGIGNRFAHAASLAVAELPGEAYNPLFVYGDPGLGKTHLLISIANYLHRNRPDLRIVYTTAERFTSEFVGSLRAGASTGHFKQRYREVDALLIDDVQFLEGKPKTEDEFFHTFNELYASGSQLVLSSDRPPEAIASLSDRLRDRFAWGLTVEVRRPDLPTRLALLRRLAVERALSMPDSEVLRQIAVSAPANLRKLEGALTKVSALSSLLGETPSPQLVREALAPRAQTDEATERLPIDDGEPGLEEIKRAACEVLRVSEADLTSSRRAPNLVRARQLAIFVARQSTSRSLTEIARAFHRDHSTVLYSVRAIEKQTQPGSDIHRALEAIHERLQLSRRES